MQKVQILHKNNKEYKVLLHILIKRVVDFDSLAQVKHDSLAQAKHECKLQSGWLLITSPSNKHLYCPINTLPVQ